MKFRFLAIMVTALLASCATPAPGPARTSDGLLTNAAGRSLYTFDRDTAGSGRSVCNGPCATNWPAFEAGAGASAAGDWTVVMRDDGRRQWAYKGRPLYTFVRDAKAGDRTGDGFNDNTWHLARP